MMSFDPAIEQTRPALKPAKKSPRNKIYRVPAAHSKIVRDDRQGRHKFKMLDRELTRQGR